MEIFQFYTGQARYDPVPNSLTRHNEQNLNITGRNIVGEITIIRDPHLVSLHTRIIQYRFLVAMFASLVRRRANAPLGNLPEIYLLAQPTRLSTSIPLSTRNLGEPWDLRSQFVVAFDVATIDRRFELRIVLMEISCMCVCVWGRNWWFHNFGIQAGYNAIMCLNLRVRSFTRNAYPDKMQIFSFPLSLSLPLSVCLCLCPSVCWSLSLSLHRYMRWKLIIRNSYSVGRQHLFPRADITFAINQHCRIKDQSHDSEIVLPLA